MNNVGIVTDSTHCLPAELIKEYDIRVVPYHLILDGKDYLDQIDITPAEFWKMFFNLKSLPTTSAISPGQYADIFTELAKSTGSIVCLIISSSLSAAYKAAVTARDMVRENHPDLTIELIDTNTAAGALGLIVLEAARAARAGKSMAEVVEVVQGLVSKVKLIFALDTLKYLIKGGRAPKAAVIGEILGVKPIITVNSNTGLVESLGKERGKGKVMQKLAGMIADYADTDKPLHVLVHYTNNIEDAKELQEMITARYKCEEIYVTDLTPVITAHTGPAFGLSFYS